MKKGYARLFALVFVVLVSLLSRPCSTVASEQVTDTDWEFALTPFYLWAIALDGDVSIGQKGKSVDLDFGSIFNNLEGVYIGHFEALYKQHYGFLQDLNYMNISSSGNTSLGSITLDLTATVSETAIFYRYTINDHALDFLGGFLYSNLSQDVSFADFSTGISVSENWIDPFVGLRWKWQINNALDMMVKGTIGGFGISSDLVWEGSALVTYQPWKYVALTGGYRAVGIDYKTGAGQTKFVYDVTMSGPIVGLTITWP